MTTASTSASSSATKPRSSCATVQRGLWALLAVVIAVGVAAWVGRQPLLRTAADLWIVSDRIAPADAVAVFGGGVDDRPFAAAAYYGQGLVKKVLVSDVEPGRAESIGVLSSHAAANRAVLTKLGVPEADIESFGHHLANTHEEALALHDWALRTGARSIIVPTEIFSARRVRWTLHEVFGDTVAIRVPALDPIKYHSNDWWQHEAGLIGFQNEVLKYIYYRFKY
jgi:uncharacterized SAM-binding protein YcdF (DUF218 family)